MPALAEVADVEVELDSRPTPYQSPWCRARRATRPSRPGLEARSADGRSTMVVDLVGGRTAESRVGPVAVVPGEVKPDLLPECRETGWDRDEPPRALVLERPDAALDHSEAAVLTDSPEPLSDTAATAPTSELLGDELPALV